MTFFLYKGVYQVILFTQNHTMILFISFALSHENVFIWYDNWEKYHDNPKFKFDIEARLAHVFKIVMKILFTTNFSLLLLLLATSSSSILVLKSLCYFIINLVIVNFILSFTWTPAIFIVHHRYIKYSICVFLKKDKAYKEEK
jgi:hypothetical protein